MPDLTRVRRWLPFHPARSPAREGGITVFDTANVYSAGASEEIAGRMLKEMAPRDEVVIATKGTDGWGSGSPGQACRVPRSTRPEPSRG